MAEINDLSVTDASNTARFPEGMAPSAVNDAARALEGIIARWSKDINGSLVATGSSNAYAVAANQTLSAYYDGLRLCFEANHTSTSLTPTLNVDGIGAITMVAPGGKSLWGGALVSGYKYDVIYNSDQTKFEVLNPARTPRGCRVTMSAVQAITTGTDTAVLWDTEDFDTDAVHSTSSNTNRLTIPLGVEFAEATFTGGWEASAAGTVRFVSIKKNSDVVSAYRVAPETQFCEFSISTGPISVSGGDYFQASVFHDVGADLDFGGPSIGPTAFSVRLFY